MAYTKDQKLQNFIKKVSEKGKTIKFCVLGAGHGGLAMAGHLAIMGFSVNLYNRSDERLNAVRWHGGIKVKGEVEGFGKIDLATSDIKEAVKDVDVLMIAAPATAHRFIAEGVAPHLKDGQIIILNPGRTGGTLEFRKVLNDMQVKTSVILGEAQTFIYASRAVSRAEAYIFTIKNAVAIATLPAYWIPDVLSVLKQAYPQFVAGDNILKTSLDNVGAVFHPALTILNAGWIEETHGNFDYYLQGVSPSVSKILEDIDKERILVAEKLGIRVPTAREWLYLTYDSVGKDLHEAIHDTPGYRGIKAPDNINHRYIFEDVPMSLVPISSIGDMLGVPTPTIKSIIYFASIMHGVNYCKEGRTVEKLGIAGLTVKEIRQLVVGIE
ncbi:MAG: NAD/NADP octopine/nopaline dehydrogenase family protein [Candidatus Firestonebacteria bacterium]